MDAEFYPESLRNEGLAQILGAILGHSAARLVLKHSVDAGRDKIRYVVAFTVTHEEYGRVIAECDGAYVLGEDATLGRI